MPVDVDLILRSLARNRIGASLVILQVAIALAVLVNAAWIVHQRDSVLSTPAGFDDRNTFVISSASFAGDFDAEAVAKGDLAYLRGLPGVAAASLTDAVPFSQVGFTTDVWTNPRQRGTPEALNAFSMDEQGLDALGVHLLAGRKFRPEEILPPLTLHNLTDFVPEIIVTDAVARSLFGGSSALGRTVYDSLGRPATIIGIVRDMVGAGMRGTSGADHVAFLPRLPQLDDYVYVVRAAPGRRDALMAATEAHLASSRPGRVIKYVRPIEQYEKRMYLSDRNTRSLLLAATALVMLATCLGTYGLAAYNVNARTRQIGARRALGARRRDILYHFLTENALITGCGIVIGLILALVAGFWLSFHYGVPRPDPRYLLGGALALAVVSELSVYYPARIASAVPPSEATRTL